MRAWLLLFLLPLVASPAPDDPLGFAPHQVWAYRARAGEERSRLVVERVERAPGHETVVWITLVGLHIEQKNAPPIAAIARIPYTAGALVRFVTHRIDEPPSQGDLSPGDRVLRWPNESSETESIASLLDYVQSVLAQ